MFGRIFRHSLTKGNNMKSLNKVASMNFRASPALNKKLSIGEAADVLEHKISGISQVVSRYSWISLIYILERPKRIWNSYSIW